MWVSVDLEKIITKGIIKGQHWLSLSLSLEQLSSRYHIVCLGYTSFIVAIATQPQPNIYYIYYYNGKKHQVSINVNNCLTASSTSRDVLYVYLYIGTQQTIKILSIFAQHNFFYVKQSFL